MLQNVTIEEIHDIENIDAINNNVVHIQNAKKSLLGDDDNVSNIKQSVVELIHPFVSIADSRKTMKVYEEKIADSVVSNMMRKNDMMLDFVPIFVENKKNSSATEDSSFLKSVFSLYSSKSYTNVQDRMYGMTFMHSPIGTFVPTKDCDAYAFSLEEMSFNKNRLIAPFEAYSGDRVMLCGAAFCDEPKQAFDLDDYFEKIEAMKSGDRVVVFDASGKRHEEIVEAVAGRVLTFSDDRKVDASKLIAFVYSEKEKKIKLLSRRRIQDECFVIATAEKDEKVVLEHVRNMRLTPRESFRRMQALKEFSIKSALDLIEKDCRVVELMTFTHLTHNLTPPNPTNYTPTNNARNTSSPTKNTLTKNTPTKNKKNKKDNRIAIKGGAGKPKKKVRFSAASNSVHSSVKDSPLTSWDLNVSVAVNASSKPKDLEKLKTLVFKIELVDGSIIAFNSGSLVVDATKSEIVVNKYPGGVYDITTLYSRGSTPQGKFLYASYPRVWLVNNMIVHDSIDVVSMPPEDTVENDDEDYSRDSRFLKPDNKNINEYRVDIDKVDVVEVVDKGFIKDSKKEIHQDPRSIYKAVAEDVVSSSTLSMLDDDGEDNKNDSHFAKHAIIVFAGICTNEVNMDLLKRICDISDRIFKELGNDVDKLLLQIAESRIVNLKKIVQRFIKNSNLVFPDAWGKDVRSAIRAIETIVQRDNEDELERLNRRSQIAACKGFMICFAANYAIDVLGGIVSINTIKSLKCGKPYKTQRSLVNFFDCAMNPMFEDTDSIKKELDEMIGRCLEMRPSANELIKQIDTRENELKKVHAFEGTVDVRPARGSAQATVDLPYIVPLRRRSPSGPSSPSSPSSPSIGYHGEEHVDEPYDITNRIAVFVSSEHVDDKNTIDSAEEYSDADLNNAASVISNAEKHFKFVEILQHALMSSDDRDVADAVGFLRDDLPLITTRSLYDNHEKSFTMGSFFKSLSISDKKIILKLIEDRDINKLSEGDIRVTSVGESMIELRNSIQDILTDDKNKMLMILAKALKIIIELKETVPNAFPDLDDALVESFKMRVSHRSFFDSDMIRQRLLLQSKASKDAKIKMFDRLSKENRQIAMMLRDTLAEFGEWDKFVECVPDDDLADLSKTYLENSDIVVEELRKDKTYEHQDDDAKKDIEEEADVIDYVGENPDDDEIDEDIY